MVTTMKAIYKAEIYIEAEGPIEEQIKELRRHLGDDTIIDVHQAWTNWKECLECIVSERSW